MRCFFLTFHPRRCIISIGQTLTYTLDGTACGLKYGGNAYYFYKNLQGDVIAITDNAGTVIARYTYDAWGKVLSVTDANGNAITSATHVANINPFRYRSYYYDAETKLYYLQSRYYDPEVGRFLNADDPQVILWTEEALNLTNYVSNDAVNSRDDMGYFTIPRDTVAFLIDTTLMLVSAYAKYAYDLIGMGLKAHAKRKGYIAVIDKLMGTVPKVVSWAGKFLTVLRTVLWRIGAVALSAFLSVLVSKFMEVCATFVDRLNQIRNKSSEYTKIVEIITCFFSTGGIVALFLDYITDGFTDRLITVF